MPMSSRVTLPKRLPRPRSTSATSGRAPAANGSDGNAALEERLAVTHAPSEPGRPLPSLLRPLGIVGYDAIEPALLAALATEEPLLLLSEHGAAKTLLLVRLAQALGVSLRHYNASLLQFDDLAGFPIPDDRGGIEYAAPPGAIWGAQAVFFDEIGRCRPEVANKLFPIVHERRIQGVALEDLRFRWAATNPPPEAQEPQEFTDSYEGVERLDPALADRFSYIVSLPRYADLSATDRGLVLTGADTPPTAENEARVRELVAATRALLPGVHCDVGEAASAYVLALTARLHPLHIACGGRRAATLRRNLLAVHAACIALGRPGDERAACAALLASIPDIVRRQVPRNTLLAAHTAAWRECAMPLTDPVRVLLSVTDPHQRAALALSLPDVPTAVRGEVLCDALSAMPRVECEVLAWHLFPRVLSGTVGVSALPATAIEMIANVVGSIANSGHTVRGYGPQRVWASDARALLAQSSLPNAELEYLHGVVSRAFGLPESATGFEYGATARVAVQRVIEVRAHCLQLLGVLDGERNTAGVPGAC
jgi:MoxR-like ATPase